ncbi:MAG: hypothetical protein JWO36_855 [Myxococcales bacterium]|nr:hypothetical protein [Myxococcales bacterium]
MAKRSPILGYNHNVRYRGLVFHVQTEDSGLQSPHLFTHMFHGGVIVATRKLVYDVGAVEDVIKNLMQAQHKAVLKELKKGGFDDKIDEYLGDTPGLLPRGVKEEPAPERPSVVDLSPVPTLTLDPPSEPIELAPPFAPKAAPTLAPPRTETVAAMVPPPPKAAPRPPLQPPPPPPLDEPTLTDNAGAVAAAVAAGAATLSNARTLTGRSMTPAPATPRTSPVPMPARTSTPSTPAPPRTATPRATAAPPPIPSRTGTSSRAAVPMPTDFRIDSSPEIEISLEPEDGGRSRAARDTAVESPPDMDPVHARSATDSTITPLPPTPMRNASHGAATLPPLARPARSPSRQAVTPPTVMTRPVPTEDGRARRESEVIEVYAPAPSSAEPPPGDRSERPGQYIVNRSGNTKEPIPSGLGRPRKDPTSAPVVTFKNATSAGTQPLPKPEGKSSGPNNLTARPRTPTPSHQANPASPRTASPGGAGVITTRPAVIVGAPQKPPATPKVRKAREEEARGFGQGLISEKSLDEVILAYLSEDAEEK